MPLSSDHLQALRDCCLDDAAFERMQQLLTSNSSMNGGNSSEPTSAPQNHASHQPQVAADLLIGVSTAISQLLTQADYQSAIAEALATLGQALGVDRLYIFQIHPHPTTGELAASQRFEWVKPGVESQSGNQTLQNRSFAAHGLTRWLEQLQAKQLINSAVKQLPMAEQVGLVQQGIQSILIVPIWVQDTLWGYIGFDDCHHEHQWSQPEIAALQTLATSLGGAIARQQVELALRESESRLNSIARNVPGVMFQFRRGAEGSSLSYVSFGCRDLLGIEPEQLLGDVSLFWNLCHPDDRQQLDSQLHQSATTLQPWNWEGRMITKSGQLKWIQIFARPEPKADGHMLWDGVLVDISDRKQQEEARLLGEARYRAMLDAIPDLMFRVTVNGRYLDCKADRANEIVPEQVIGNYIHDLLPTDIAELCLRTIRLAIATGELQTCEYQLQTPRGLRNFEARVTASGSDEALAIVQDVTERKRAEAAIRQSEARNRALVNAIPDLMFRIRRDGTYVDCKAEENLTLMPPHELIGKSIYDVLPVDLAEQRMTYIHKALDTGEMQRFEYQLQLRGGSRASQLYRQISPAVEAIAQAPAVRDYEARVVVSGDDEVLAIVRDITDRKLAEMALRFSEEKFAKAFHSSPNPMTISTIQLGRILEVNDSFLDTTGYTREEVLGRSTRELKIWSNPGDRETVISTLQQQGAVRNLEFQFRVKSGELRTSLFSAEVITIGGELCMLSSVIDITDRQRAEQQLWASAERERIMRDIALRVRESLNLNQIMETAVKEVRQFLQADRVFIGHIDVNDRLVVVAESLDPQYPSLMGDSIDDPAILAEIYAMFAEGHMRVINDSADEMPSPILARYCSEHQVRAGLAMPILVNNQFFGLLNAHQCSAPRQWDTFEVNLMRELATQIAIAIQQAQLYKQVRDLNTGLEQQVSERTAQLQQKMEELQELNQLKDEFLNAFSHDLRTPVMGISLVINNLLNSQGDTVPVSRFILERMLQSSDHQLQLLNSLLQAHSAERRGVILNYELVQVSLLVQVIVEEVEPLVEKNQAHMVNQVPSNLPLVNADPLQLRRVFENLITNALHHNPPGITITLDAQDENDFIRFTLTDNGVGMNQEMRDRLFTRYSRGPNSRHATGVGLGLYLCYQIITAHGGQIGVESQPGDGAQFWFTLPLAISSNARSTSTASDDA